ncbi:MAG: hypothetical protein Q4B86_06995 [Eubacteriales bacterium]|nr:hypothetical protein [Eubacteriales bacterium]
MNKKLFALIMGIIVLLTGGVVFYGISNGKDATAFYGDGYVRECFVKINKGNISPNFASKIR